jgi:hypothetical protein
MMGSKTNVLSDLGARWRTVLWRAPAPYSIVRYEGGVWINGIICFGELDVTALMMEESGKGQD